MSATDASRDLEPASFVKLMKAYVVDYTNSHDQTQVERIMEPDYTLRMGSAMVNGRDGAYAAATRRQLDQFPGLCLTVHEIYTAGDRLALRFTEHGASIKHGGARASWAGIGLYRWNGSRLTTNSVEQDYYSRAAQLASGLPRSVESPAISPWDTVAVEPDAKNAECARRWLEEGRLGSSPEVRCDDAQVGSCDPKIIAQERITINDLFSCGSAVAFHASQHGPLQADFAPRPELVGRPASLHMAGILHVADGRVCSGRVVRNRLELSRSLVERT